MGAHSTGKWGRAVGGSRPRRPNEEALTQESRQRGADVQRAKAAPGSTKRNNYSYIAGKGVRKGDRAKQEWCYLCNEGHAYHRPDEEVA